MDKSMVVMGKLLTGKKGKLSDNLDYIAKLKFSEQFPSKGAYNLNVQSGLDCGK
jgi:hypothetical protein